MVQTYLITNKLNSAVFKYFTTVVKVWNHHIDSAYTNCWKLRDKLSLEIVAVKVFRSYGRAPR